MLGKHFVQYHPPLPYKSNMISRSHSWSFTYNSFVKFHDKKIWETQHYCVISKSVLLREVLFYKGTAGADPGFLERGFIFIIYNNNKGAGGGGGVSLC